MVKKSKNSKKSGISFWHPAALLCTWFGVGKIPFAPGTWGSLAAVPTMFLLSIIPWFFGLGTIYDDETRVLIVLGFITFSIVALFFLGVWAANVYCNKTGKKDPGEIVIDEVVAQMLTYEIFFVALSFIVAIDVQTHISLTLYRAIISPAGYVAALIMLFLLFRLFDIFKPWPASWADEKVKGGMGVMLDDIFAAIYAALAGLVLYIPLVLLADHFLPSL